MIGQLAKLADLRSAEKEKEVVIPQPSVLGNPNPSGLRFGNVSFSQGDVNGWIYKISQLLDYYGIVEEQRVTFASLYLELEALQWFR